MAKPVFSINVRASQTNYTTGPISTQTKDARTSDQITEGYVPDSPLGTFPVAAQGVNFHDNQTDEVGVWVLDGSNQPDSTAHIVETDASGKVDIRAIDSEIVRLVGVSGSVVLDIVADAAEGLVVHQHAASIGAEFIGAVGAPTQEVVKITAEGEQALVIDCTDEGAPIVITAENAIGVSIGMIEDGGGNVGPSLFMSALGKVPTLGTPAGSMWSQQQTAIVNLRAGMQSGAEGYVRLSKNAPCYARSASVFGFVLSGTPTDQIVLGDFTWDPDVVPSDVAVVRITIWGQISQDSNSITSAGLFVRDKTAGGDPTVHSITIATPDSGVAGFEVHSCTSATIYTLPSSGARDFDLVWSGDAGAASGALDVFVEIEQVTGG